VAKAEPASAVRVLRQADADGVRLTIVGRLDGESTGTVWADAVAASGSGGRLVLDGSGIDYCDGAGIGLVVELHRRQLAAGGTFEIEGLQDEFRTLLAQFPVESFVEDPAARKPVSVVEDAGRKTMAFLVDVRNQIEFFGQLLVETGRAIVRPRTVRWRDVYHTITTVGADATPIMSLMGFLIGLIIAFQSAAAMKPFGAEVYTADALALALVRELGPIMTGIILAGRSGSAFAAEIGTMKFNEEIDALTSFGFSPLRFLVIPRMFGAMLVTPLLLILNVTAGLVAGAPVVMSYGYPLVTYVSHCRDVLGMNDIALCLTKGFVFGAVVAAIGCLRGLQTGSGAQAVGVSTTRSVVAGIVLVILLDFVFALVCNSLGI
jgi:phospholipid/cholesterol/gamma-HCH transport system permease protein